MEAVEVAARGSPFMAPSADKPSLDNHAVEMFGHHFLLSKLEWVELPWSEELAPLQESTLRHMAEMGSKFIASSSVEQISGRLRRGSNSGGLEKAVADERQGGGGEVNLGERWFTMETSPVERQAMFHLEKETEATLIFKHGGSRRASQLWVTRILLGRLFWERLSLDRAVKSFAKFQRRQMMRGLVKLNELKEVVEPPLRGHPDVSVSRLLRDDPQDLDMDDAVLEEEGEEVRFSPGESRLSLL